MKSVIALALVLGFVTQAKAESASITMESLRISQGKRPTANERDPNVKRPAQKKRFTNESRNFYATMAKVGRLEGRRYHGEYLFAPESTAFMKANAYVLDKEHTPAFLRWMEADAKKKQGSAELASSSPAKLDDDTRVKPSDLKSKPCTGLFKLEKTK